MGSLVYDSEWFVISNAYSTAYPNELKDPDVGQYVSDLKLVET